MSKIIKLTDGYYLDSDAIYLLAGNEASLKYQSTPLTLSPENVNEIRKIFDKEIEVRKAEERVSPFRLDPIEFVPCKDCGKNIPISIPDQGCKRSTDVSCWPCHEKEIKKKEEPKDQKIKCGLCGQEASLLHIIGGTPTCQTCEDKYE